MQHSHVNPVTIPPQPLNKTTSTSQYLIILREYAHMEFFQQTTLQKRPSELLENHRYYCKSSKKRWRWTKHDCRICKVKSVVLISGQRIFKYPINPLNRPMPRQGAGAEPFVAPIIGVRLQYRSKWELWCDFAAISRFLVKHKGLPTTFEKNRSRWFIGIYLLISRSDIDLILHFVLKMLRSGPNFFTFPHLSRLPFSLTKGLGFVV